MPNPITQAHPNIANSGPNFPNTANLWQGYKFYHTGYREWFEVGPLNMWYSTPKTVELQARNWAWPTATGTRSYHLDFRETEWYSMHNLTAFTNIYSNQSGSNYFTLQEGLSAVLLKETGTGVTNSSTLTAGVYRWTYDWFSNEWASEGRLQAGIDINYIPTNTPGTVETSVQVTYKTYRANHYINETFLTGSTTPLGSYLASGARLSGTGTSNFYYDASSLYYNPGTTISTAEGTFFDCAKNYTFDIDVFGAFTGATYSLPNLGIRFRNSLNYILVQLYNNTVGIYTRTNGGSYIPLATAGLTTTNGTWYHLTGIVNENNIKILVDGTQYIDYTLTGANITNFNSWLNNCFRIEVTQVTGFPNRARWKNLVITPLY